MCFGHKQKGSPLKFTLAVFPVIAALVTPQFLWAQRPNTPMTTPPGQQAQRMTRPTEAPSESSSTPPAEGNKTADRKQPPLEEKTSVTHHSSRIGSTQIDYTATAGNYVLKSDDGTPKASMFYVAYTKDNVGDITSRPLAFVFNGGPGSASLFTHMGLGPRRVPLTPDGRGLPAPYRTEDNNDSFLDATDMVFVDAISTGYSRPAPGENANQFHGVIQDANWFSDFIYQYITRNTRWGSPKFLIGESYGTTRAAELSGVLQERHQMYLSGVVLLSSVAFANFGADDRTVFFLPTFIMTAWYHKLLPPDLQKLSAEEMAERARDFVHGEYAQALDKGDRLSAADQNKVVADLARYTGLSTKYLEQTNLRVSPFRWFRELERDKRLMIGRLDSRFENYEADAAGERMEFDASEVSYEGAYVAAFQDYVRRELKWNTDMYYTVTARVQPWDQTGNLQVAEVLRAAMTQQGFLKVLVLCGYFDVATPFNGIEHTVNHMGLEPPVRKNISFAYYEAGHMIYIDKKSNDKLHKDVNDFITSSYSHR